ncbi:MAG: DNA-binding protein [Candidatus Omnitrophica bacterium]|nr:DNA-binding protein [Candidatus Omnitrophota bacterium]
MSNNRKLILITLFTALTLFPAAPAFSQALSSGELIKEASKYDGKTVTYAGEVIGDIMRRGESAWVNISDGNNALGVWMSAREAKEIEFAGNYKNQGDSLEVTGVFHRACLEHGGDMDIHAKKLRKLATGKEIKRALDAGKKKLGIVLLGVLFLIWILTLFKHR